jgi:DNA gyrase inhibitor GyrI
MLKMSHSERTKGHTMSKLEVRIVRLEPLRVAAAHGFGSSPEPMAWEKLLAFARKHDLLTESARFFGFNNPDPSPGSPNYGYEQWITVGEDVQGDADITIKTFPGGLYAVLRCTEIPNPTIWMQLVKWAEASPYHSARHQWLEELVSSPETLGESSVFDLYLPIRE